MAYSELLYCIWLSQRYPYGSEMPGRLLRAVRKASLVYGADREFLFSLGFTSREIKPLSAKSLDEAERIAALCSKLNIEIIPYSDKRYPTQLFQLIDPPAVIYCRGTLPDTDNEVLITAVGTRKMSDFGRLSAHKLCFGLGAAGAVVVSGMAYGIDSVCHAGALDGGGKTVAVLGCGCDVIYPEENAYLYGKIIENGAIISEFPPNEIPKAGNFPTRNRIMAALGACTVVVEAGIGSGALITASKSASLGRTVYAVPGPISTPTSKGSNLLLKEGAAVCTCAEDILVNYELTFPDKINIENINSKKYYIGDYSIKSDTGNEDVSKAVASTGADAPGMKISRASELQGDDRKIYEALLSAGSLMPEELSEYGIDVSRAIYRLTLMEISGHVKALPGGKYTVK